MGENKFFTKSIITGGIAGAVAAVIVFLIFFSMTPNQILKGKSSTIDNSNISLKEDAGKSIIQEDLVIDAVKKAQPAVVSVIITKDVPIVEQYFDDSLNSPFDDFFGQSPFSFKIPQYREKGTEKKEVGGGSGFLVSSDGYVVTNKHVVSDKEAEYTVFLNDGTKYSAEVLALDPLNDLAIIKIDGKNFSYLEFGDSDKIQVGQTAIAIGNPLLKFNNSVSVGVISGLSRSIVAGNGMGLSEQLEGVIQTDAAINPGNSGGPLLNLKGEVVGVNVAVASGENIGFSLPSNLAKSAVLSVKQHGKIIRPFLGVRYMQITPELKEKNKLTVDYGALIIKGENKDELAVIPGSPADKAGLVENDIILEADGIKLEKDTSLARIIAKKNIGDKVKLKVLSKGKEKEVEITLEEVPE